MIKKLLGIHEIERSVRELRQLLSHSWGHTRNLYSLGHENRQKIMELERKLDERTKRVLLLLEELLNRLEGHALKEEVKAVEVPPPRVETSEKDNVILQILHQNAAFSREGALSTQFIYNNLPFSITQRGLRKKLYALERMGLIARTREGKENKWYIRTGKLAEVKEKIAEPSKKKRNRN